MGIPFPVGAVLVTSIVLKRLFKANMMVDTASPSSTLGAKGESCHMD